MAQTFIPTPETDESSSAAPRRGINIWVILALIAAVLICCCFVMFFIVPLILSLSGASIGNVFSNIIEGLGTPVP